MAESKDQEIVESRDQEIAESRDQVKLARGTLLHYVHVLLVFVISTISMYLAISNQLMEFNQGFEVQPINMLLFCSTYSFSSSILSS